MWLVSKRELKEFFNKAGYTAITDIDEMEKKGMPRIEEDRYDLLKCLGWALEYLRKKHEQEIELLRSRN